MFNEKQCPGYSRTATVSSHTRKNFRKSTSCHCLYIKNFMSCYYLQKMLSGNVDIDWQSHVTLAKVGTRRAQVTRNFICKQMRLQKRESDFWYRACHLANLFNDYFKYDILLDREHKSNSWNSTIGFSCPATTNQTLALGVSCVAAITVET